MGSISLWQLLIILLIVLLLFGTKKLRNVGADLGGAAKGFRDAMRDTGESEEAKGTEEVSQDKTNRVIEGQVTSKDKDKA